MYVCIRFPLASFWSSEVSLSVCSKYQCDSAHNKRSPNTTNNIFHGWFQREILLRYETDMCLISFLHIFTQDFARHNRQLIIIHQVGCACFPLVSAHRQGRSHSSEWANPLQIVQTIGLFLKHTAQHRSLQGLCESHWAQTKVRMKDREWNERPSLLSATWSGFNYVHFLT